MQEYINKNQNKNVAMSTAVQIYACKTFQLVLINFNHNPNGKTRENYTLMVRHKEQYDI